MKSDDMHHDDRLRALLHDAVDGVEPRDRLADVRRRTRSRHTSGGVRWAPLLVGAGAVAATVVAATFVVGGLTDDDAEPDAPVAGTSTSTTVPATAAAGLYFLGDSPTGPRLYREFQAVTPTTDPEQKVLHALQRLTSETGPRDPDYRTLWPADAFTAVRLEADRIVVELGTTDALESQDAAGHLGVQQAVYTAEAALGDTLPVAFELDGEPTPRVLGARVGPLVMRDRSFTVTAPVNITDPAESLDVESGTLAANGTMSTNARRVRWQLLAPTDEIVLSGRAAAIDITGPDARATLGSPGWETGPIDVSGLAPGEYVFVVRAVDVGQTSDSPREFSDTRTITVR